MSQLKNSRKVEIIISGEQGSIIGFAEYLESPTQYYISYKSADGRAVKDWFYASELKLI